MRIAYTLTDILPLVAQVDLFINSFQLHKLVNIVDEGEEDGEDDVSASLADSTL